MLLLANSHLFWLQISTLSLGDNWVRNKPLKLGFSDVHIFYMYSFWLTIVEKSAVVCYWKLMVSFSAYCSFSKILCSLCRTNICWFWTVQTALYLVFLLSMSKTRIILNSLQVDPIWRRSSLAFWCMVKTNTECVPAVPGIRHHLDLGEQIFENHFFASRNFAPK